MAKKIIQITDEFKADWVSKETTKALAEKYGVHRGSFIRAGKKAGLSERPYSRKVVVDDLFLEQWAAKVTLDDMAEQRGCHRTAIGAAARRAGLGLRGHGGPRPWAKVKAKKRGKAQAEYDPAKEALEAAIAKVEAMPELPGDPWPKWVKVEIVKTLGVYAKIRKLADKLKRSVQAVNAKWLALAPLLNT